jgi:hypothetical protein
MAPTITYLEFKPASTPAVVKLYPVGGVDDTILATAGAIIQLDDPDTDETGRWRASFLDLTARDYQLIATEGGGSVVADERYTVTAATIGSVIQPWSEAKPLTLAEIAAAAASALVGFGDRPVTVTVTDNLAMPVRFATVNIYDASGEPLGIYGATDLHGEAQFQLNAGTYVVAIGSLAGFDSHTPQAITVAGGPLEVPVMLTRSPTVAPSNPALCVVRCRIVNAGGQPLRNAVVQAQPLSKTTSYDQVLVTLVVTSATTNAEGYCELVLPRAASLIGDDNKQYRFTVRYETRAVFAAFVGLVPDASEAWLEDILNP